MPGLLTRLGRRERVLFLVACGGRQFGNYAQFHLETGWGIPQALCDGLQALLKYSDGVEIANVGDIRRAIEMVTPDTEDFESVYASAALDAAVSLLKSLDYCVDNDVFHCLQVACLCRDSIYMFVQLRERYDYSDASEAKIYADPLMMRELQAQRSDIDLIKSLSSSSSSIFALHRHSCDPDGGSRRG